MKNVLKKQIHQYTAVFESDDDSIGYTVTIPALPGCISEGDTFEEALLNIKEAASLYLEVMRDNKEKIVTDKRSVIVTPVQILA